MKKTIALILLLVSAMLFGCTQKGGAQPSGGQPGTQPKVTAAVEDIAADELAKQIPSGEENFTELDDILVGMAS
ncbi:MAG: hypothetical protein Sv326_0311 [Candidatus Fermentimicrarchaeum limneticum]|uniref:Uncharacterized protein n=1 Tax=Fermentimicrarchaeum limneticum TaxID=2795018 RepID=A0A7D5XL20_FERL1|nr:MAG: hypothetical protein Sv326_0311 [Candidatus Fermentimicrarchaeum limneticum]